MQELSKERLQSLFEEGSFAELIPYGERLLRIYPEDCDIRYVLGMAYVYTGQFDEAERVLSRAIMLDERSPLLLMAMGKLYAEMKDYRKALSYLNRAIQYAPNDREVLFTAAYIYDEIGDYRSATELYRRLVALYPDDAQVHNNLGVTMLKQELYNEAMAEFEKAVSISPNYVDAWENIAVLSEYRGLQTKAIEAWRHIVSVRGSCDDFISLGNMLFKTGKSLQALRLLERAKKLYPDSPRLHYEIALIYMQEGNWRDALDELHLAERLGMKEDTEFLWSKAVVLFNLRMFKECLQVLEEYERVVDVPDRAFYDTKVRVLLHLRRWKEALNVIDGHDIQGNVDMVYFKGIALYRLGRYAEALDYLQRSYDAGIVNENICRQLARAYAVQGDVDSSLKYWKRLLDITPEDKEARAALRQDTKGQREMKVVVNPEHVEKHRELARMYAAKGMEKEALWEWKKVLLIDPYDLEAMEEVEKRRG